MATGQIRVGPAGWTYDDWEGIVYPRSMNLKFDELSYISTYFDTIEINSSFYRPPAARNSENWAKKVAHNPNFKFTTKLYRAFTHERKSANAEAEEAFRNGIEPLRSAGKLGALLMQFPWSFKNTEENREYLLGLIARFKDYPLALEVRHASWNKPAVYQLLEHHKVAFTNIDQPVFAESIEPSARVTSEIGYIRLHGRNYENWFSDKSDAGARYDYLYSPDELNRWIEKILEVAQQSRIVYVIANNTYQGKGLVNGLQIRAALEGGKALVPEILLQAYPQLQEIAES